MSDYDFLCDIYRKKAENGLKSVSYTYNDPAKTASKAEILADLANLERTILEGKTTPLKFGDATFEKMAELEKIKQVQYKTFNVSDADLFALLLKECGNAKTES